MEIPTDLRLKTSFILAVILIPLVLVAPVFDFTIIERRACSEINATYHCIKPRTLYEKQPSPRLYGGTALIFALFLLTLVPLPQRKEVSAGIKILPVFGLMIAVLLLASVTSPLVIQFMPYSIFLMFPMVILSELWLLTKAKRLWGIYYQNNQHLIDSTVTLVIFGAAFVMAVFTTYVIPATAAIPLRLNLPVASSLGPIIMQVLAGISISLFIISAYEILSED